MAKMLENINKDIDEAFAQLDRLLSVAKD